MKTTVIPAGQCLACGAKFECATHVDMGSPDPGDATVCFSCGHIMVFGEGLTMHNPTEEEMQRIAGDREILLAQRMRVVLNRRRTQ